MSRTKKTIFHLDMNAYFAAVEQQSNPALRGKPIAICGRGRTVVATASYEARRFGVKTGMTLSEAKRCCPDLIPVEGNHIKYIDTSRKIHEICLRYTEYVEIFSIDEVFMDIGSSLHLVKSAKQVAADIKKKIKSVLGLTCSIGIAPTKILAKLASGREKPDGLVEYVDSDMPYILKDTPVEDICGIGNKTKNYLNTLGIKTLVELGNMDIQFLRKHFGFMANILQRIGKGEEFSKVSRYNDSSPAKSVGHSNTFPKDTWDIKIIKAFLLMLSERVGMRLRKYGLTGRAVALHVRYGDFTGKSRRKTAGRYIRTGMDIYKTANIILEEVLPLEKPVRLVGISISNLSRYWGQRSLFEELCREERIEETMDKINKRQGEFFIRPFSFETVRNFTDDSIDVPARVHGFCPDLKK
ncbi:DNA polymerase IV [Elusimicrobiota bacterium]